MSKQNKTQTVNQPKITIDPKFQELLPVLTPEELESLEQDIKEKGCLNDLIVGKFPEEGEEKEYLIDGHNRYTVCKKLNKSYSIKLIDFDSREEVISWIIANQKNRRNMTRFRWVEFALKFEGQYAQAAKDHQKKGGQGYVKSHKPVHTLEKLGELANAGTQTVHRVKYILDNAGDDDINKLRMGYPGVSINKTYRDLKNPKEDTRKKQNKLKGKTKQEQGKKKTLSRNFGKKLGEVRTTLGTFEEKLSKKRDITKLQSLIKTIEKLIAEVDA